MTHGPTSPRPPMTFEQQAELLEYLHGRMSHHDDGSISLVIVPSLDQAQVDDLLLTAKRLRRMVPYEDQIKDLVTGR